MKHFGLILMFCVLVSCGGAKKTVENNPKPQVVNKTETAKEVDAVIEKDPIANEIPENILTDKEEKLEETQEMGKQVLTKRVMPPHELWDELLQKHVSDDGNVNYKSFKTEHKELLDYLQVLNLVLSNDGFETLPKNEKLAYWINAYNAFTVDLILRHYPVKSIKDIKDPWEQRFWKLGNKWYNLNEIEHQILRKMDEPRIHFAIVCASYSCPKLNNKAFAAADLETQLTKATKGFLNDSERNEISEHEIRLSKIFQWFAKDFKQNGSLIDFLNQYSDVKISAKAKKRFKDYNWDLNE